MEKSMLIRGKIPNKEPLISVGLILPIDKQNIVEIFDSSSNSNFKIETINNSLFSNGKLISEFLVKNKKMDSEIKISPVNAGRGFHWEKKISISVLGKIQVKIHDGYLFVINHLPLEDYLVCVATSEMSGSCPPSLLEAQTIAARSWLLAAFEQKHKDLDIDACNDDCCQRYQGIANLTKSAFDAGNKTRGEVLIHEKQICDARYSKSCGGISEDNENVWSEEPKQYLRGIFDGIKLGIPDFNDPIDLKRWYFDIQDCFCGPGFVNEKVIKNYLGSVDEDRAYFRWRHKLSQEELVKTLSENLACNFGSVHNLDPVARGISGRILKLEIKGEINGKVDRIIISSEYEIRRVLHKDFLFSSSFIVVPNCKGNSKHPDFELFGAGWGHGVGLCQIGALGMAMAGKSKDEVLMHYYMNSEITKIY